MIAWLQRDWPELLGGLLIGAMFALSAIGFFQPTMQSF